ncbi:MAG: class I SAM-dependent methyltransferase, partial [Flavobacterium sp.]
MNQHFIENTIIRLCQKPRSFDFISSNLFGLDPIVIKEYLNGLESKKKVKKLKDLWIVKGYKTKKEIKKLDLSEHKNYLKDHIPYFDLFKKPHPLDFEWRNSAKTLDSLTDVLLKNNVEKENVLLLGMPSLFVSSFLKKVPQNVTLIEKNKPLLSTIAKYVDESSNHKIINEDIFTLNHTTVGKFNSVFMDPPWYPDHFYHFIWLASQCLEIGGVLGISIPPINTRPGVDQERIDWFSYCQKLGLCLESLDTQKLEYVMPFFEFNAFRSAGLENIQPFWRKGDFALFRKTDHKELPRPNTTNKEILWVEREIGEVRFRIKIEKHLKYPDTVVIDHLVNGDILPSVSSRDLRRQEANLWTTGNRIFNVKNPQ